ncbi:MAG: hypothetical protein ACJ8BW_26560 [Ktedonobacteraceae bacterium]
MFCRKSHGSDASKLRLLCNHDQTPIWQRSLVTPLLDKRVDKVHTSTIGT